MAITKMGFEGEIYYGTVGTTAATQLTNARDISYNLDTEQGDTTVRGGGVDVPIKTNRVTALSITIEWTMLNKTTDTSLEALRTAAYAGYAVAIRTKDYASGKGFDGDCTLSMQNGMPIAGEQTFVFTATPTDDSRVPVLYT